MCTRKNIPLACVAGLVSDAALKSGIGAAAPARCLRFFSNHRLVNAARD